jgi:hypothetical protein
MASLGSVARAMVRRIMQITDAYCHTLFLHILSGRVHAKLLLGQMHSCEHTFMCWLPLLCRQKVAEWLICRPACAVAGGCVQVGMAAGATHAALTQHFATAGSNAADISAKVS